MLRHLSVLLPLLLAAGPVGAAEIPQSELDWDYSECIRTCGQTVDKAQCTNYCACALQGVQEQLDLEEYTALGQAIRSRQPGESSSIAKLEGIMSACAAEVPN